MGAAALANHLVARASERRHPPRGRMLDVDGVHLHWMELGEGQPVLLLHGNGGMAEELLSSGLPGRLANSCRVLLMDRPGFGHSTRPRRTAWTARAQAKLLLKALARLGIRKPLVVGHSWGALVACAMAVEDEDALGGLVLLSGYYSPEWRWDVALNSIPAIPILGELLRYTTLPLLGRIMANGVFRKIFRPAAVPGRFRAEFPTALALRPSQLRATAEDTAYMTSSAAEIQARDSTLTLPVVIVAGDADAIVDPERHSLRLHRRIAQSHVRIVAGAGHMVHHSAPDAVEGAIRLAIELRALPPAGA